MTSFVNEGCGPQLKGAHTEPTLLGGRRKVRVLGGSMGLDG
jgi:hypothetical protein